VFSEDAAAEMAEGVAALLGADVAVTTSGVAGIEPVDGVEPGTVFVATYVDGDVRARAHRFEPEEPESICSAATERALLDLLGHLEATARERTAAPGRRGAIEPH
jgi:nicotinamide-nucleotide amidase